jgi:hypothetical protein
MVRAKRARHGYKTASPLSRRLAFDSALRPRIGEDSLIAYPDAIYCAKKVDFNRAFAALNEYQNSLVTHRAEGREG